MNVHESVGWCVDRGVVFGVGRGIENEVDSDIGDKVG